MAASPPSVDVTKADTPGPLPASGFSSSAEPTTDAAPKHTFGAGGDECGRGNAPGSAGAPTVSLEDGNDESPKKKGSQKPAGTAADGAGLSTSLPSMSPAASASLAASLSWHSARANVRSCADAAAPRPTAASAPAATAAAPEQQLSLSPTSTALRAAATRERVGSHRQATQCVTAEDGSIKMATVEALVERLTSERHADATALIHFLLTFNLHTSAVRLFQLLVQRYNMAPPAGLSATAADAWTRTVLAPIRLRVFIFLNTWVERLWNASTAPELVAQVESFAQDAAQTSMRNPAEKLLKAIRKKVAGEDGVSRRDFVFTQQAPQPLVPLCIALGQSPPEVSLLTVHLKELARQMALVEQEQFRSIKAWEFQDLAFTKKDKTRAPNVHAFQQHFNRVSRWATTEIMKVADLKERIRMLELFIDLAEQCNKLQNYNAVNEIVSACSSASVFRLHKTWAGISAKHQAKFRELAEMTASTKSFSQLRQRLHAIHPPCIPFIGIYLSDLTFIEEGNPTMHGDLVNWHKCRLQAGIIIEIQTYQQSPYCLEDVPWIQNFFLNLPPSMDDTALWNQSLLVEPREKKPEDSSPALPQPPAQPLPASSRSAPAISVEDMASPPGSPLVTATPSAMGTPRSALSPQPSPSALQPEQSVTITVLPPGCTSHVTLTLPGKLLVREIKQEVLRVAQHKKVISEEAAFSCSSRLDSLQLIAAGSRAFPLGLTISDDVPFSELPDFARRGLDFYALFRAVQVVDVLMPSPTPGGEAIFVQTNLDFESPLFSAAMIVDNLLKVNEEFVFLHVDGARRPRWLNSNRSLREQNFDLQGKLVVFPTSRLARTDSEEKSKLRLKNLQRVEDCTFGYLIKSSPRALSRPSTLIKQLSAQSQTRSMLSLPKSSSGSAGNPLAASSAGSGDKDKRWFLAIDNFLYNYKDCQAQVPRHVWALEYCRVTLGMMHGNQLCVVVRPSLSYPFKKGRPKVVLLAGTTESVTRTWFTVLARKSLWGEHTRVFGVHLGELAVREASKSLVPDFIRRTLEAAFRQALHSETLFTGPATSSLVDRIKDSFDNGAVSLSASVDPLELNALVQLVLVFLCELPEPLLTYKLFHPLVAYSKAHPDPSKPDTDALRAVLAPLPQPNAVLLRYLLTFFRVWAEESGVGTRTAAGLLGPLILRPPEEDLSPALQAAMPTDMATIVVEDLLLHCSKLGMPTDAEAFGPFVAKYRAPQPFVPVPVTVFSPEECSEFISQLDKMRMLDLLLDDVAPQSSGSSSTATRGKGQGHSATPSTAQQPPPSSSPLKSTPISAPSQQPRPRTEDNEQLSSPTSSSSPHSSPNSAPNETPGMAAAAATVTAPASDSRTAAASKHRRFGHWTMTLEPTQDKVQPSQTLTPGPKSDRERRPSSPSFPSSPPLDTGDSPAPQQQQQQSPPDQEMSRSHPQLPPGEPEPLAPKSKHSKSFAMSRTLQRSFHAFKHSFARGHKQPTPPTDSAPAPTDPDPAPPHH